VGVRASERRHDAGRPTIYEVASRAGVSASAVSRALRGRPGVSAETRARIDAVAAELGYIPSGPASGLALRRTGILGVVFRDLDDPTVESGHETLIYADQVLRGAERAARRAGAAVLVTATHTDRHRGVDVIRQVAGKVDGVIALAQSLPASELAKLAERLPVVLLAGRPRLASCDVVRADNEGGAYAATTHLLRDHGYREVAFVAGPSRSPDSAARFRGYCRAREDAGLSVPRTPEFRGDFTEASGWAVARQLLSEPERLPRALVVGNDQMAAAIVAALSASGYDVPTDVAVTGFDDAQLARLVEPGLTTVHQPLRELGERSVEFLLRRLENPDAPAETACLETRLVVRRSCGCAWCRPRVVATRRSSRMERHMHPETAVRTGRPVSDVGRERARAEERARSARSRSGMSMSEEAD
jgi:LacI family transcriptional regulator